MQQNTVSSKDVTFLIPIRADSPERQENLYLVLTFIKQHFDTLIIVLEADKMEQVHHPLIDQKLFVEDHDPVFHRTKYLNQMIRESSTPYLAIWDTDVLVPSPQIELALSQLREGIADMIFPYDGHFYSTSAFFKQLYQQQKTMDVFELNRGKFLLPAGRHSVGGAFMVNREAYLNAGMENENFYGWGAEDVERVKRWEILGYCIKRIDGALYHLHHPRMENSWFASQELELRNRQELIKICRMTTNQVYKYIKSSGYGKGTNVVDWR